MLVAMMKHFDIMLETVLRSTGPPTNFQCSVCHSEDGYIQCTHCFGSPFFCHRCLPLSHRRHPLHVIKAWNGTFFEDVSLFQFGIAFPLGHHGDTCPSTNSNVKSHFPDRTLSITDFAYYLSTSPSDAGCTTVVHDRGVFRVRFTKCVCPYRKELFLQYLELGFFPSTTDRVQTVFTTPCLQHFALDILECKTTAEGFYSKITRLTNDLFPQNTPVIKFSTCQIH
jgi:hypothetical protein